MWRLDNHLLSTSRKRVEYVFRTPWRNLEVVLTRTFWLDDTTWRRLEDPLKTSWRCLEDIFARSFEDVLKTSWTCFCKAFWRCLEDVWLRQIYSSSSRSIEQVLKTSSVNVRPTRKYSSWSRRLEDVLKTSLRCLQDVFTKSNVCWVKATV